MEEGPSSEWAQLTCAGRASQVSPVMLPMAADEGHEGVRVNVEEINVNENVVIGALPESNELELQSSQPEPAVGMKFNNFDEIFEFYKSYTYQLGFPLGKELPGRLSEHVKRKLEVNDIAGIPLHKSFNSVVVEAGGYDEMSFIEKDCRNYIDKVRRLKLGEGDAAAIQSYFSRMQAQCSEFLFSIDLDDEGRLKNVFWADNRCRQAYREFGDVVSFDTTYLTNKYDMPFAPFVGVNHHGQSTLLGCGLVSNNDTCTFVWLFKTWLECMEYQPPGGIITDQDRAMQNAIQIVFPNTRHRWCLWHILKKLPEKFGNHSHKGSIFSAIHELVYDSHTPEEFNDGWSSMLKMYNLHNNAWLSTLYAERARWVPCFLKTSFWAGMSTTQRSESITAFFDGYIHSKTSLKQFVEQHERALRSKVEKEFQADFKSYSQMVPCVSRYALEKQFQAVYTISKFKEVQEEFISKMYCEIISADDGCLGRSFVVREDIILIGRMIRKVFSVVLNVDKCDIVYSCHLFEFKGIICRHAITVLVSCSVTSLPDKYILKRWRRDIMRPYTRVKINYDGWTSTSGQLWYEKLCTAFSKVACLIADDMDQAKEMLEWLEARLNKLTVSRTDTSQGSNIHSTHSVQPVPPYGEASNNCGGNILDPKSLTRKGAPKKSRKKGPLEMSTRKSKVCSKSKVVNDKNEVRNSPADRMHGIVPQQYISFPMQNHLSYTQQLMGTQHGHWNALHGMNLDPTHGVFTPFSSLLSTLPPRSEDN